MNRTGADWSAMKFVVPGVAALGAGVWLTGRLSWSAPVPYWAYVAALVTSATVSTAVSTYRSGCRPWQLHLRVAAVFGVVTLCMYMTGWGALLSIGYLYVVAEVFEDHGSRATRPLLAWAAAWSVIGLGAVALRVAPTMVQRPLVYGLGLLTTLGLLSGSYAAMRRCRGPRSLGSGSVSRRP